jgi:hypothetical protein
MASLDYRVAIRATSFARMRAALLSPPKDTPKLSGFDPDAKRDPALALLDAWATVVDVLSFYQERIANEGFIRTAIERRSVVELARLVGQRPRPGVAADTYLAYTVEKGHDAVEIQAGAQAQSVPKPGEEPQTFETTTALIASARWNRLLPLMSRPTEYAPADIKEVECDVKGIISAVRPGRPVLTWTSAKSYLLRTIIDVEPRPSLGQTRLRLSAPLGPLPPKTAPPTDLSHEPLPQKLIGWFEKEFRVAKDWLVNEERLSEAFIRRLIHLHPHRKDEIHAAVAAAGEPPATPDSNEDGKGIHIFPLMAGLFGSAAAEFARPKLVKPHDLPPDPVPHELASEDIDGFGRDVICLDNVYDIPVRSPIVILGPSGKPFVGRVKATRLVHRANYDLVARVTELTLELLDGGNFRNTMVNSDFAGLRETVVYAAPLQVNLADALDTSPIGGAEIHVASANIGLEKGRTIIISGTKLVKGTDATVPNCAEVATVARATVAYPPAHSVLELEKSLVETYDPDSVVILGNVVPATHGQTVRQTLGSGDGSASQSFLLRQGPLVYVSAGTETGSESSLVVRVDGVRWHEADDSSEAPAPAARAYIVEQDETGAHKVVFGDRAAGARVSSGVDNVTAVYRIGKGSAGNVSAAQISLPITRPLGVTAVTNPLPATGGANPESRELIRRNAPRSTTLFDRLVSESDYEHFAAAFAGVAKAKSRWLNLPGGRRLCLTVSGVPEAPLDPAGELFANLAASFHRRGDPRLPVQLVEHRVAPLQLTAAVMIDPDYLWEQVEPAVRAAVFSAFGFPARDLGAPFELSPLVACIQRVKGVVAVDVRRFGAFRPQSPPPGAEVPPSIDAEPMFVEDGRLFGYEVLCFSRELPTTIQFYPWPSANREGRT